MGTSSMIANYNEDGTVTATYCHYDGYLSYNGRLLFEAYNTPEKAKAVANAGYISGLKEDLQTSLDESVHSNQSPVTYNSVEDLTILWTIKECLYKLHDIKGLSFKNDIRALSRNNNDHYFAVHTKNGIQKHRLIHEKIDNEILTYNIE